MKKKTSGSSHRVGSLNEGSLHKAIKEWYAKPGDQLEIQLGNYIIDILRGDQIIEIQTGNFAAIRTKLQKLCKEYKTHLVYPLPKVKWIVQVSPSLEARLSRRKSPKKGKLIDIFNELLRIPTLIDHPNFSLEILLTEENEIRCDDRLGSWRRKGVSIIDRELVRVIDSAVFKQSKEFISLLPEQLEQPFSNKTLAEAANISVYQARRVTYAMKKMGAITEKGKNGRELLFTIGK